MTRYLIVAHQTAESPELVTKVRELTRKESEAEFGLVVPATPVAHLLTWTEGESRAVAGEQVRRARALLEREGAQVVHAGVGDSSPIDAIRDELLAHPNEYEAIVICTLPPGISHWLRLDLPSQARRAFDLPVIHVEAQPAAGRRARGAA